MSTSEEFYEQAQPKAPWESRITIVPESWYATPPPPRQWLLRDARSETREGVFPLGKVGLLAAAGGAGKTMAITQLSVAVATGTSWLGAFDAPRAGKVLLALGEEDAEEVHRRVHRAAREAGHVPPEGNLVVLPLAGMPCRMVEGDDDSQFLLGFREHLKKTGPYALVVIDPVSRFAGADTERDNAAATRFVTALESLIEPSGGASILGSHHTNQTSRSSGATVDATSVRGVSAMVDGCRWVSVVQVERFPNEGTVESVVTLSMAKSNYSMIAPPVQLRYGDGGVLVPMNDADRAATDHAREEADPKIRKMRKSEAAKATRNQEIDNAVLTCVKDRPGIGAAELRHQIKAMAGCGPDAADTAIARMLQANKIRRTEGKTKGHFVVEVIDPPPATNGVHHFFSLDDV